MNNKRKETARLIICICFIAVVFMTDMIFAVNAYGESYTVGNFEDEKIFIPEASGTTVYENELARVDASNLNQGYVMIQYMGINPKVKVQITKSESITYTYNLNARNAYEVFPFSEGDGEYSIRIFENISGKKYKLALDQDVSVNLEDQFLPFLYPNQYVNFTPDCNTAKTAEELTANAKTDVEAVACIYDYIVDSFTYDKEKAANIEKGYLPDTDLVFAEKSGICLDYASVMVSMLRSENIPSKLVVGYAGNVYHAWINVYTEDKGWIDGMIYFDGDNWNLMDPATASTGKRSEAVMRFINDSSNYTQKYAY